MLKRYGVEEVNVLTAEDQIAQAELPAIVCDPLFRVICERDYGF
jgi:stalled ribosome alternative rescue factor ArfA